MVSPEPRPEHQRESARCREIGVVSPELQNIVARAREVGR
jgi:hypothetical protein